MEISILPVENRLLLKQFLTCPQNLTQGQRLDSYLANMLNPRINPWFAFGTAKLFIAVRGEHILGRIAVFSEPRLTSSNHGYFGLLETTDDMQVCGLLLNHAEKWLASEGRTVVLGPITFNSNYETGLLVEGFKEPRCFLPAAPPYYAVLLERLGYKKAKDFIAYEWNTSQAVPPKFHRAALRIQKNSAVIIRSLTDYPLKMQVKLFSALYQQAMKDFWEFAPLNETEIKGTLLSFREESNPELLLIAEYRGEPAGLCLTLVKSQDDLKLARVAVLVVAQQFRRRGIDAALIIRTIDELRKQKVQVAELSYVDEDNLPATQLIAAAGGIPSRRYRVYSKA